MEDTSIPEPMGFGQIFTSTLTLIRRTLASAAIPAYLILVGVSIIQGFGTMLYIQGAVQAMPLVQPGSSPEDQAAGGMMILKAMIPLLLTGLVAVVGVIFAQVMTAVASWRAIINHPLERGELMERTAGRPLWYSIIQTIILGVILGAVAMLVAIMLFASGITDGTSASVILGLLLLYPITATVFRIHKIAIEDRGPWQGLISSIALANSSFGRILGALMLLGVVFFVVVYGLGMISGTGPVGVNVSSNDPKAGFEALKLMSEHYTWGVVILNSAVISAIMLVGLYLLTPLYADARARRGDFLPETEDEYGTT